MKTTPRDQSKIREGMGTSGTIIPPLDVNSKKETYLSPSMTVGCVLAAWGASKGSISREDLRLARFVETYRLHLWFRLDSDQSTMSNKTIVIIIVSMIGVTVAGMGFWWTSSLPTSTSVPLAEY